VSSVPSNRGWSGRHEIGRRVRPSTFRRGRRRTLCSAGNAHIRATTGHRVGTPWRRSSAGSRGARHPEVLITRYPGLPTHPTHDAARRQLKGFGTIISFDVRGGTAAADAVCARLRLIQHATSLGAVESTMERRASVAGQEHLSPSLLRLSVGIEAVEDLWADLDRALRDAAEVQEVRP
jgi:Cys/Met metabolism PLP-dependent enzyme